MQVTEKKKSGKLHETKYSACERKGRYRRDINDKHNKRN
jgi:hypothetical protein